MPKFLVERDIPGAGAWTTAQRQAAANRIAEIRAVMDPTTAEG